GTARAGAALRVGIIGAGGRGMHLVEQALAIPNVNFTVVCDVLEERVKAAQAFLKQANRPEPEGLAGGPYAYRELLKADDLDCVIVASPVYWHGIMYTDALEAGMHFYGEKPLGITPACIRNVTAAWKKNPGVVAQMGFQWGAHLGRRNIIKRVREEGLIGELLEGNVQRLNEWDTHGGWYTDRAKSGDWMLEQAVHEFNLMWMTIGAHPTAATTIGRTGIIPGRNTTNYYTTILEYPGNLIVRYSHGWIQVPGFPGGGMHLYFTGRKGALNVMDCYAQLREAPAGAAGPGDPRRVQGQGAGGDTREHLANFFDAVRAGDPAKAYCGIENGIGASYIGLMIRTSLEKGAKATFEEMLADTRTPPIERA
ncbi:MAG: Gfo/Idh/MocA family oxidoreductase, partial [Planctomycetes bacterium]|nr:Gfo/Idh/MocA family oxidoreductase [Planctomycetota bacterium]